MQPGPFVLPAEPPRFEQAHSSRVRRGDTPASDFFSSGYSSRSSELDGRRVLASAVRRAGVVSVPTAVSDCYDSTRRTALRRADHPHTGEHHCGTCFRRLRPVGVFTAARCLGGRPLLATILSQPDRLRGVGPMSGTGRSERLLELARHVLVLCRTARSGLVCSAPSLGRRRSGRRQLSGRIGCFQPAAAGRPRVRSWLSAAGLRWAAFRRTSFLATAEGEPARSRRCLDASSSRVSVDG